MIKSIRVEIDTPLYKSVEVALEKRNGQYALDGELCEIVGADRVPNSNYVDVRLKTILSL